MWTIIGISLMKISPVDPFRDEQHLNLSSLIPGWGRPSMVKVEGNNLLSSGRSEATVLESDKSFEPLRSFLRLDGADGERIAEFARRWGVLGICEHRLPASHNRGLPLGFPSPI